MPFRSKYVATIQDAAKIVGVSERTVYNWVYQKKIEAYELPGGGWRIPLRALSELVGMTVEGLRASLSTSVKNTKNADDKDLVLSKNPDIVKNLARGGDFEGKEDLKEWQLHVEDGSGAILEIDRTTAATGKSSLFIGITQLSDKDYSRPRISQGQVIRKGKIYTLSAFYKAEEERSIYITVQLHCLPWTLFVEKEVIIGAEWEEHWAKFTAPQDGEVTIQPARNNNSYVNYWIDGIRFFEGEYKPYNSGHVE